MVLRTHHQTLGFQAHQKPSGFFVLTTNTCVQFRDGQNLYKVYTIEYKKAPLEQIKCLKHIIEIKNKLFESPFDLLLVEALASFFSLKLINE